jgi:hypothetical protein
LDRDDIETTRLNPAKRPIGIFFAKLGFRCRNDCHVDSRVGK